MQYLLTTALAGVLAIAVGTWAAGVTQGALVQAQATLEQGLNQ